MPHAPLSTYYVLSKGLGVETEHRAKGTRFPPSGATVWWRTEQLDKRRSSSQGAQNSQSKRQAGAGPRKASRSGAPRARPAGEEPGEESVGRLWVSVHASEAMGRRRASVDGVERAGPSLTPWKWLCVARPGPQPALAEAGNRRRDMGQEP